MLEIPSVRFPSWHQPATSRLSESKEKEVFEELPLCIIKERYDKVEGGKKFIAELLQSGCLNCRMKA